MWMPAAHSLGLRGLGEESGWPLEGETWSPSMPTPSRTACTAPPHQNRNAAPLVVAIETSPKEVSFGFLRCRHSGVAWNSSPFFQGSSLVCKHTTAYEWCLQLEVCKYVSVSVYDSASHSLPPPPTPYQPVCPRGHPEWQMSVTRRQVN